MDEFVTLSQKSTKHPSTHYFDLFLFVNPLDPDSFRVEKEIFTFVQESDQNVSLRILCYHENKLDNHAEQSAFEYVDFNFMANYQVALAFKTAALQGKQVANQLLLSMQKAFINNRERCRDDAVKDIIRQNDIDYQTWLNGFTSRYIRKDYQRDIQLMKDMRVDKLPTLIVSDSMNDDCAIKIEQHVTSKTLEQLLEYLHDTSGNPSIDELEQTPLRLAWRKEY